MFLEIDLMDSILRNSSSTSRNIVQAFRMSRDISLFLEVKLPMKDSITTLGLYADKHGSETKYFELFFNGRKGKGKLTI